MILLTDSERIRFAAWLEQESHSNYGIMEQMEKFGVPDQLVQRYRAEAAACEIIASKLRATEAEVLKPNTQEEARR